MTDSTKAAHDLIDTAYCRRKRLDGDTILGDAHAAINKAISDAEDVALERAAVAADRFPTSAHKRKSTGDAIAADIRSLKKAKP